RAFQNFFRGLKTGRKVGFPKFKKKGRHDSFRLTGAIHVFERHIQMPRFGKIRVKEATEVQGRILSATVRREADRWFVSLAVEMEICDPIQVQGPAAGIDVGLSHFATIVSGSESVKIADPKPLNRYFKLLRRRQRRHSRKQKGSRNRKKSALQLARLHRRVRNIRQDFLHKLTTEL
ncbi:MAG TPA: transposase, partial [Firmicutes bacterium]|nr:transposase [Bacillota bacterium]